MFPTYFLPLETVKKEKMSVLPLRPGSGVLSACSRYILPMELFCCLVSGSCCDWLEIWRRRG